MTDLAPIVQAVRQALTVCQRVQQSQVERGMKGGEVVTIADYSAQAIICRAISLAFPGDAVIAEEHSEQFLRVFNAAKRAQVVDLVSDALAIPVSEAEIVQWLDYGDGVDANRVWMIDPIDGTNSFTKGVSYTVAVGVMENGILNGGILGAPRHRTPDGEQALIFYTHNGEAWVEPAEGGDPQRVVMEDDNELYELRVSRSPGAGWTWHTTARAVADAAGVTEKEALEYPDSQNKYLMVASGNADVFLYLSNSQSPSYNVWDHAAGAALVEAAGGVVTDAIGQPLDFSTGKKFSVNRGIIAAAPSLHERLLQAYHETEGTKL